MRSKLAAPAICLPRDLGAEPPIHTQSIVLEDLASIAVPKLRTGDDVSTSIVVVKSSCWIYALNRAQHFGRKENIIDGYHLGQEIDSGLMIDASIEEYVLKKMRVESRALHFLRQPSISTPMVRHSAASMRNDDLERREVLEQISRQQLHERGGIAIDVVGACCMKIAVARSADMNHSRNI